MCVIFDESRTVHGYCWTCGKLRELDRQTCMCKQCLDEWGTRHRDQF